VEWKHDTTLIFINLIYYKFVALCTLTSTQDTNEYTAPITMPKLSLVTVYPSSQTCMIDQIGTEPMYYCDDSGFNV